MTDEISIFFERLLPESLERFLVETLGEAIPRRGEDGRYRVLAAGRFSGHIVGDLFTYARNQELDAALVLVEKDVLRILYFAQGMVIGSDSNVVFERLGRLLGQADIVQPEEADILLELEEKEGVASAAARIAPEAAHWGLERRVWEVACGLYYMPHAHYVLVDGEPDLGDLPRFHIPPMDLAMEGLRRYDEWRNRKTTPAPKPREPREPRALEEEPRAEAEPPRTPTRGLEAEVDELMRQVLRQPG